MKRLAAAILISLFSACGPLAAQSIDFESSGTAGSVPKDFSVATTGRGQEAVWALQDVAGAPSGKLAVAQKSNDATDNRFPVLVYDKVTAQDADISVKFKPVSGANDRAAGLVWRYVDKNNYYIVRANALEDNVVLYIVKDGRRTDLPVKGKGRTYGAKVPPIAKDGWSTLAVSVKGNNFKVSFNGQSLYEVEDNTFTKAGKIGLWTKADSVMLFDDLKIENAK